MKTSLFCLIQQRNGIVKREEGHGQNKGMERECFVAMLRIGWEGKDVRAKEKTVEAIAE